MNIFGTSTFSFLGIVKGVIEAIIGWREIFYLMFVAAFIGLVLWYFLDIYLPKKFKNKKK